MSAFSFAGWKAGFSSALNTQEEGDDADSVATSKRGSNGPFSRRVLRAPLHQVVKLFEELKAKEAQGVKSYLAVMRACSREGNLPMLIKFMKEMEEAGVSADKFVYNTYIHAFVKSGNHDGALEILNQMKEKGLSVDGAAYRSMMLVAAAGKLLDKAKEYFDLAVKVDPNDVRNYNFMMTSYDRLTDASNAKEHAELQMKMMEELKSKHLKPDNHTYQHLIKAYSKAGMLDKSMELLEEATSAGVVMRLTMYDIQMEGLASSDITDEELGTKILKLFQHMEQQKLKPTSLTFERVVKIFIARKNVQSAMEFLDRMKKENIKPLGGLLSAKLYATKLMGEAGSEPKECLDVALSVLNEYVGLNPSNSGLAVLFEIFDRADALDKAVELWSRYGSGSEPRRRMDEGMVESLMHLYLKHDKAPEALALFDEMKKIGAAPRLQTFRVVLEKLAEKGDKENAETVHKKMTEAGIEPDDKLKEIMKGLNLV